MYRVIKASDLTADEESALRYWKQGNNGWGYADVRDIVNGRIPRSVKQLRDNQLDEKANHYEEELEKIAKAVVSAVERCPSVQGKTIYRVTSNYAVPAIGSTVEMDMFTSFAVELTDRLLEDFGVPEGVVYRLVATDNFKDVSKIGKSSQDAEGEVLSTCRMKYKVLSTQVENIGGEETWLGNVGGTDYTMVDLQPLN